MLSGQGLPRPFFGVYGSTQVDVPEYVPESCIELRQDDEYFLLWRKATIVGRPPLALGLNAT